MEKRILGRQGLEVSAIGLGCMGMSFAYGHADEAGSIRTLDRAIELGVNSWDTAEVYGPFKNEELLGKVLRTKRDKVIIATKFAWRFGMDHRLQAIDGGRDNMRRSVEGSLRRLHTDHIDLFYLHRLDPNVSVEETVSGMAELVKEGKVRYIGLSKVEPSTIRRAHAVHPLSAVQNEYSLWERGVRDGVLSVLNELGIGLVAYSPLGCGFLTGKVRCTEDFKQNDFRLISPRFQNESIRANLKLIEAMDKIAAGKGVTLAQISLAWLLAQGEMIVPLPGTTQVRHLEENVAAIGIKFTGEEMAMIETILSGHPITGMRIPGDMLSSIRP